MLFDSFEAYDVQETRRISRAEGKAEGKTLHIIELLCKKIQKGCSISDIADMLEADESTIQRIYDIAIQHAPDYNAEEILEELNAKQSI